MQSETFSEESDTKIQKNENLGKKNFSKIQLIEGGTVFGNFWKNKKIDSVFRIYDINYVANAFKV